MTTRRPFRVDGPAPRVAKSAEEQNPNAPGPDVQVSRAAQSAINDKKPLPLPSQEVVEGIGHGHSPRIPYPPAKTLEHNSKPFKNTK